MLITPQITSCCFGNSLAIWEMIEQKEGMIIIIIIIVSVIWGAGAPESCDCLRFIKTCSPSALVLSHILQRVKLFVSGCVGAVEGGERDMCVSQQLHWSGIEERAVWFTTAQPPVNLHTLLPPCPVGTSLWNRWQLQDAVDTVSLGGGANTSSSILWYLTPQCRVYDLSAVVSWSYSMDVSSISCRMTAQEEVEVEFFQKMLQRLWVINTTQVWSRQAWQNCQTKEYRSPKAHWFSSLMSSCNLCIRCQSVWLIVHM